MPKQRGNWSSWTVKGVVCAAVWLGPVGVATAQMQLGEDRVIVRDLTGINSVGLDYSPALYENGIVYVSTQSGALKRRIKSRRRKAGVSQLWFAAFDSVGVPSEPQEFLPGLRTRGNEGPVSFSIDAQQIYLTRAAEQSKSSSRSRVAQRLQIFVSNRTEDRWSKPVAVDLAGDGSSADAHPAIAPDGTWLVFASDRDGGLGGMDLWGAKREGAGWGLPFNLGKTVNSDDDEVFPFLHPDGTLYYSARIAGDAGGGSKHLDLFFTRQERGQWIKPAALGAPFNGPADDFGLVVDAENRSGFFSSTRSGGLGGDDLYGFSVYGPAVTPPVDLLVEVIDAETRKPVQGAAITYLNADRTALSKALATGVVSASGEPMRVLGGKTEMTDIAGRRTVVTAGGDYLLEVSREGYEPAQLPVTLAGKRMSLPIMLSPKRACASVRISVVDEATLAPVVGAQLRVEPQGGTVPAPTQELSSGRDGIIDYCLPCGDVYALTALLGDRLGKPAVFDGREARCSSGERTTLTLYLAAEGLRGMAQEVRGAPLSAGTSLQLPSVFYALNDFKLSAAAKHDLDGLVELLNRYPDTRIELGSHTDAVGDAGFNQQLSQRRADEARRYLMESGKIAGERVVAIGYGEAVLRNGCRDGVPCSAEAHRENRRTEVVILGKDGAEGLARRSRAGSSAQYGAAKSLPEARGERVPVSQTTTAAPGERDLDTEYIVVAGSYGSIAEAETSAKALTALGYRDIQVAEVKGLVGKTVVAGRFQQLSEAAQFSRALREAHGLSAYVRKVNP